MKMRITTLFAVAVAVTLSTSFAFSAGLEGSQVDRFMGALSASGVPTFHRFTIVGGSTRVSVQSIDCILSSSAPFAAFVPTCTVVDQNGTSHRVPANEYQEIVDDLKLEGIEPSQEGSEVVLKTGPVACFSVSNFNEDPASSEGCSFN